MTRLLLIEDHGIVRDALRQLLQKDSGEYIVDVAASGTEALNMLCEGLRPDVLLIDLHLGDMSGIELTEQAKAIYPDTKVVLLTDEADESFVSAAFRSGASGYILKEADSEELLFGLRKVVQGRRFICTGITERLCTRLSRDSRAVKRPISIGLSSREAEILELIADGYTNLQIAGMLFTSRRTVEGHRLSLLNKTGTRNSPELIKFAMLNGLLNVAAG